MHSTPHEQTRHPRPRGFSLIELLIVAAVGAIVFTGAALAYRVVAKNQRSAGSFQTVHLPPTVGENFYPGSGATTADSYTAPNFGRCAQADTLRTLFLEEVEKCVAVYVLPRAGNVNRIRGRTLPLLNRVPHVNPIGSPPPQINPNRLPPTLDTPAAFLAFLGGAGLTDTDAIAANAPTATNAQVFTTYRGVPPNSGTATTFTIDPLTSATIITTATQAITNASIFLLQPSGSNAEMWIRAVYEIDYIGLPTSTTDNNAPDVPCVFASVRRYVDHTLTHYYDVVYREADLTDVGPPCVHFERGDRAVFTEAAADKFKKAANQPFYMIWWPDPAMQRLRGTAATTYAATSPQSAYAKHEGQTSYYLIVPQFPAL